MKTLKWATGMAGAAWTLVLIGCAAAPGGPSKALQDGEVPLPADYRSWTRFLSAVQRPDLKQVREIYVNRTGAAARPGQPLPQGTTFVMENYAAELDDAGTPVRGADGQLVKGRLLRVFVMSKGPDFGSAAPPELRNGDWAYAAYDAAGMKTADALGACRACHLPQAGNDFVFRLDEFFRARGAGY